MNTSLTSGASPMVTSKCPACIEHEKASDKYLCYECWGQLKLRARRALQRRDSAALSRYRELRRQLLQGIPLSEIEVTP